MLMIETLCEEHQDSSGALVAPIITENLSAPDYIKPKRYSAYYSLHTQHVNSM